MADTYLWQREATIWEGLCFWYYILQTMWFFWQISNFSIDEVWLQKSDMELICATWIIRLRFVTSISEYVVVGSEFLGEVLSWKNWQRSFEGLNLRTGNRKVPIPAFIPLKEILICIFSLDTQKRSLWCHQLMWKETMWNMRYWIWGLV